MDQQLGLVSIRLPAPEAGLAELLLLLPSASTGSGPSRPVGQEPSQVAGWVQLQRQNALTALDWAGIHAFLSGTHPLGNKACQHLVSLLGWAADGAVQQLRGAAGSGAAVRHAPDAGNPRHQAALRNTLKLSLAFLAFMAKGSGSASSDEGQQAEAAPRRGKKAKAGAASEGKAAAAAAAALPSLHLRRDALLTLGAIAEAVTAHSSTLLPAVADLRAAERLWRAGALHCLVHPPAGAVGAAGSTLVSAKAALEDCYAAAAGVCSACRLSTSLGAANRHLRCMLDLDAALSCKVCYNSFLKTLHFISLLLLTCSLPSIGAAILARPFLTAAAAADQEAPAQPSEAPAVASAAAATAAARTLQELLSIVSEPKQTQQVGWAYRYPLLIGNGQRITENLCACVLTIDSV